MGTLKDQLARVGLVSVQQVKQTEALAVMEEAAAQKKLQQGVMAKHANTWEDLKDTATIREFRDKARKLLVERPDMIDEVIRLAHQFKGQEGGKRLVWQVFSVRDHLRVAPPAQRDRLLRRAFRAHGATMEVPASAGE